MRLRLVIATIGVVLTLTGCVAKSEGNPAAGTQLPGSGPSKTLGAPSEGPGRTVTDSSPASSTTTVTASSVSTAPATEPTVVTSTNTEYSTVFETESPVQPTGPTAPSGPAAVIGPLDMGPNSSGYVAFQSPSGNIMCAIYDDGDIAEGRCDIADWHYQAPPQTQNCEGGDFQGGVATIAAAGPGIVGVCAGDTVADRTNPVLAYGKNAGLGRFGCHSAENGVTCANLATDHGFRLSRDSYQIF